MNIAKCFFWTFLLIFCVSCASPKQEKQIPHQNITEVDSVIVDSNYSFDEAIAGSNAPEKILSELSLINVKYYSTDQKIHKGQILTNKMIATEIMELFDYMFKIKFPVAKAIPIVFYNWNDKLSMQDNNTYSFCYRNPDFSKHATGMAIDINPFFNPIRWKDAYKAIRTDRPIGAVHDTTIAGTFYPKHPVVLQFENHNFRWGRYFKRNFDDHHFEKNN